MDQLLGLVFKCMMSLSGPAASELRRRQSERLAADLAKYVAPDGATASLVAKRTRDSLLAEDLTQRELIDLFEFLRSDSGQYFLRLICIHAITSASTRVNVEIPLQEQGQALMRLHARRDVSYAAKASIVIVREVTLACRNLFVTIRKRRPDFANEIRTVANEASSLYSLLNAQMLGQRGAEIWRLAEILPTQVENEIRAYATLIASDTGLLTIHTMQGKVIVPVHEALVFASFGRRHQVSLDAMNFDVESNVPALAQLLGLHGKILIVGDPGGGKSTSVQSAVHHFASQAAQGLTRSVPFRIVVRHYAEALRDDNSLGILRYLLSTLNEDLGSVMAMETLRYLLDTGRAVVFFDGLDEILAIHERQVVVSRIERFVQRFVASAFVITSREVGYDQAPLRINVAPFQIRPFSDAAIREFASHYLRLTDPDASALANSKGVDKFMNDSSTIPDIRANPLLLGVLCNLTATGMSMPKNRVELYSRCAEMLFSEWDRIKGTTPLIDDRAATESAVRELALKVFMSGTEEIGEKDLRAFISEFFQNLTGVDRHGANLFTNEALRLWRGRQWMLIEAGAFEGETYYRFSHRTFMEFFAAEQTAFDAEDGLALWAQLKKLVTSRVAVSYCLLAIQLFAERARGAGDQFFTAACDALEVLREGQPRQALNTSLLMTESLGSVRLDPELRLRAITSSIDTLAPMLPWTDWDYVTRNDDIPLIAYDDLLENSVDPEGEYATLSDGDDDESRAVTVDDASAIFRHLAGTGAREREVVLSGVFTHVRQMIDEPWRRHDGLGLCLLLMHAVFLEGWVGVDENWCEMIADHARNLWGEVCRLRLDRDGIALRDFWLAVELLRSEGTADSNLLLGIGLPGLLAGGTALPTRNEDVPTVAHSIVLALLDVETLRPEWGWTSTERTTICKAAIEAIVEATTGTFLGNEKFERDARHFEQALRVPEGGLESTALSLLLALLARAGDTNFVRNALGALSGSQTGDRAERLVDLIDFPGEWDGEFDVFAWMELEDGEKNALAELLDVPRP